ncbi:transcriptional regulator family: Fungal Specific TF [Trichoderma harzianum]|nr:transcriptional regulator family: Fungal Specific TF [Trichoderma harzianum]
MPPSHPASAPAPGPQAAQRQEPLPFLATALSYTGASGPGSASSGTGSGTGPGTGTGTGTGIGSFSINGNGVAGTHAANAMARPPGQAASPLSMALAPDVDDLDADGDVNANGPQSPADAAGMNRRPGKRPAARGTAFYPRKRANTACQVCRARKTKCDNKKPACSYCVSVGATCIQSPVDLSSFDPASLKILDRIDELERLLRHAVPLPGAADAAAPLSALAPAPGSGLSSQHRLPPLSRSRAFDGAGGRIHGQSSSVSSLSGLRNPDDELDLTSLLPQRVDHILQWPAFQNSGTHHHSPASFRAPPDAIATPPSGSASLAGLIDMDSHRIYRLLDNFFLHIHCKNPILDEVLARRMVLNAFLDGIDWSPASCLALIICALGCIATPFGPSGETKLGTQTYNDSQIFFQAAQKRIGILLVRSDIVGAQCLFLSGIYLMMVFQPVYAWRFFSQALAACQHFPFLARAQNLNTSLDAMEMGRQDTQEQAVYWSAWKSERELRQELDLPDFDILHSGSTLYPPFFPAPPVAPAESPDGPDIETQRARAAWLFYLAEISLRRLTSRLSREALDLRQRYSSDSMLIDMLLDMMPEYEAQIREWSDSLPADLSIHTPVEEDGICRSVLRGRMINLFEQIYWPFVMASISAHSARRPVKPAVAEFAKRGLETHMHQVHVNKPGFHHRHHGSMFMIRACTRSALVLLAAAKAGCAMPTDWEDSVYKTVGMLAYWEDEDRDLIHWRSTLERELALARHE